MAYIAYSTPKANGAVYATVVESTREGSKVKQQRIENLGRVIDAQKGIFKNRKPRSVPLHAGRRLYGC